MKHIEVELSSRPQSSHRVKLKSRIAELREQLGMTQRELADYVGVTGTTIANWEKGRRGLEWFDRIIRLCSALDCKPDELVSYMSSDHSDDEVSQEMKFSDMQRLLGTLPEKTVSQKTEVADPTLSNTPQSFGNL